MAVAATVLLSACNESRLLGTEIDPQRRLNREDYSRLADRPPPPVAPEPPIPALQPIISNPGPPIPGGDRLVSVTVTDTVPLKDVLIELARRADVDLQMDPRISGGVVFSAREQTFMTVLDRLCDLAGLRYSIKDGALRIELDEPFHQTYRLDVLNMRRNTTGSTSITTNVFASVGSGGSGNNSSSAITAESNNDIWNEVDISLRQIMVNSARHRALAQPIVLEQAASGGATVGGAIPTAAPQPGVTGAPLGALGAAAAAIGAASTPVPQGGAAAATTQTGTPAGALPPAGQAATGGGTAAGGQSQAANATALAGSQSAPPSDVQAYSINRNAGVVSIYGTQRQQIAVRAYFDRLRRQASSQVLIESRIVEVTLRDEYRSGINWRSMFGGDLNVGFDAVPGASIVGSAGINPRSTVSPFATGATVPQQAFTAVFNNIGGLTNLAAIVQFLETFGTVRALSSPRLTVLNNQTAILKVAQNQVYFTSTVTPGQQATATSAATPTVVSSTANTIPVGVVMAVQPAIDQDNGTVLLTLRPTISRIIGNVADPGVTIAAQALAGVNVTSLIPVVEVREIDSVLRVRSGAVAVLGGLMRDEATNQDDGIPGASQIPLIGNLFKARTQQQQVTELVILLRATIVENSAPDAADVDLYRRYQRDPRPVIN